MTSLIIGCDIDGVVLDFNRRWHELYQAWFGNPPAEDDGWNNIVTGTHFRTEAEFFAWFERAGGWFDMDWVPGAPGALDTLLTAGHRLRFVTSRKPAAAAGTVAWQRQWYPAVELNLSISEKTTVLANVYIDDAPHQAKNISSAGKPVILFDQPWNKDVKESGLVVRAHGWNEVLAEIERMLAPATIAEPTKVVKK